MPVRFANKRLVRTMVYCEDCEPRSRILLTEGFRGMNQAKFTEGGIKRSVYFRTLQIDFTPDEIQQWGFHANIRGLKRIDELLRRPDTDYVRGKLSDDDDIHGFAYMVSEKSIIAPCLLFPWSEKHHPRIIRNLANEICGEGRFDFDWNTSTGEWYFYINEIPEGSEAKKRRHNDLFWAKLKFA